VKVGLVLDDCFRRHRAENLFHPECPGRVVAIDRALRARHLLRHLVRRPVRPATRAELARVHAEPYLTHLEQHVPGRYGTLGRMTYHGPESWDVATRAAGAVVDLALDVARGRDGLQAGFAAVRPPGHHAERERALGFCLLNHVAIAAAALLHAGLGPVAVLDLDYHHGNGTQQAFWDHPDVLFLSLHRRNRFPGTGHAEEVGGEGAAGTVVNVPLGAGASDADLAAVFERVFVPILLAYRPRALLISAGFDAHRDDPLGDLAVTHQGFAALARGLARLSADLGRSQPGLGALVGVLEGGYHVDACAISVAKWVETWLHEPGPWPAHAETGPLSPPSAAGSGSAPAAAGSASATPGSASVAAPSASPVPGAGPSADTEAIIATVREVHRRYWELP
jgi:acetoin utilization deacetylase AcuC-like enzyme